MEDITVPEFMIVSYSTSIYDYIEQDLLPTFVKKFTLPKEQEWQDYLLEVMPKYKASNKDADHRVLPFDLTVSPFPRLL